MHCLVLGYSLLKRPRTDRRLDHFRIVHARRASQRHGETPERGPARCGPPTFDDFRELKYLRVRRLESK
jgi:hypothetical protein